MQKNGDNYEPKLLNASVDEVVSANNSLSLLALLIYNNRVESMSDITSSGTLDMSGLRSYDEQDTQAKEPLNLKTNISGFSASVGTVKLPFNCQFSNINLANADSVEYTKLIISNYEVTIDDSNIIKIGKQDTGGEVFGHYAKNPELGVTLPADSNKVKIVNTTRTEGNQSMSLSPLAANPMYNQMKYRLLTDHLDDSMAEISADTTYNFGFTGSKAIGIKLGSSTEASTKAIFKGNSSEYAPADDSLTLPSTVEFAGDSSLFPVTQTYGKGIFSGEFTNEIPAGKTAIFTKGNGS